jgi:hypothetical protein
MEPEERADAEDAEFNILFFITNCVKQRKKAEENNESAFPHNQNIEISPFALFEKHEI